MEELKDRVKYLRIALKIGSQEKLAEILNVNGARVKSIETGRVKDLTAQEANILVKNFNLDIDWLLTGNGEMFLHKQKETLSKPHEQKEQVASSLVNIPYFEDTYAAAGVGGYSYDDKPTVMAFDSTFLKSTLGISEFKNLHIITAVGDSMTPTITSGELLFINPFENENNTIKDKGVYVLSTPNGLLVKRIKIYPIKKMWTLISDNPKDDDIELMEDEIDSCRVVGRVVGHFDRI